MDIPCDMLRTCATVHCISIRNIYLYCACELHRHKQQYMYKCMLFDVCIVKVYIHLLELVWFSLNQVFWLYRNYCETHLRLVCYLYRRTMQLCVILFDLLLSSPSLSLSHTKEMRPGED